MPQADDLAVPLPTVDVAQFFAVDLRSAVVTAVEDFPEARNPAYRLRLDLGPLGERVSSAQATSYAKDELLGSTVVCVVNFPPRRVAGFKSEVLVLGVYRDDGTVVLLRPDRPVPPGRRVGRPHPVVPGRGRSRGATGSAQAAGPSARTRTPAPLSMRSDQVVLLLSSVSANQSAGSAVAVSR